MVLTVTDRKDIVVTEKAGGLGPWSCCAHSPAVIKHPAQLDEGNSTWFPAAVPGTVASALHANGQLDLSQPLAADAFDWWYRTAFDSPHVLPGDPCFLCFDGLATLAEVWLNGQCLLTTDNMFRAYRLDIAPYLQPHNRLAIVFRSLAEDLLKKRARSRWKTNLVQHQQLRWRRTSLLGRIPSWSPPVPPAGPWRAIRLEAGGVNITDLRVSSSLDGATGVVTLSARVASALPIDFARLRVADREAAVRVTGTSADGELGAELRIPNVNLWWPHTHGDQVLFNGSLIVNAGDEEYVFSCGKIGFRRLQAIQDDGLAIQINGAPVYCRGACWTVADIVTLTGDTDTLAHDLRLARDAGINLLRVVGAMVYESDPFYNLCDELGILVWQDFMFANMDYPVDDQEFATNIEAEATYQLGRLARHPSVVVYCGNSEVEQQAAMLGVPRELWRNRWFADRLPKLCAAHHPGTAYVPSTPSGGVMPFHSATGIAHYYGVGAYLRSPRELRQANVKFAPECLAFANLPEPETVNEIIPGGFHHPQWKQRIPRDAGAGWDFEDVRDHYLKHLFDVNPVEMRSFNMPRYLQLSRVVPGEMMSQVFAEWRSGHSKNQGGLVWFFKDLWPSAGWGIVDSFGRPKAAYYYLRRTWANQQLTMTDEGLDGLHLHVINETARPLDGTIEVLLLRDHHLVVARQAVPCKLGPRARRTINADEILGAFHDVTYAYRFGPSQHDVVIATLFDQGRQVRSEAFYFVRRQEPTFLSDAKFDVNALPTDDGYSVTLGCDRFLQSVNLSAAGFLPDDNYFHLVPGREKIVRFKPFRTMHARFHGYVEALNLRTPVKFSSKVSDL